MPTFEADRRFWNDYRRLDAPSTAQFRARLREFVAALAVAERGGQGTYPRFPNHPGIKRVIGYTAIWEFRWAEDGRCTFQYGIPPMAVMIHVRWRRIGSHEIYDAP